MVAAVQSGQWALALCWSVLQHCSVLHLGASSPRMHINWGLREDFPPTGWTPWDGPDLHFHLPILPCSLGL